MSKQSLNAEQARQIGGQLGIDWKKIELEQFRRGLEVELEHGSRDPETNVTNNDMKLTGKIAWAHLKEFPDYYTRLDRLEAEADVLVVPHAGGSLLGEQLSGVEEDVVLLLEGTFVLDRAGSTWMSAIG